MNYYAQREAFAAGWREPFLINVALNSHDAFDEHFGAWRAAWNVDIDWDELIASLDDSIRVEDATS